mgnify:CR=1 FL=1
MTAGQVDIFEALGEAAPQPPFTVYTGPLRYSTGENTNRCGWCHRKVFPLGGEAAPASGDRPAYVCTYCESCHKKYGHPRPFHGTPTVTVPLGGDY